MNRTIESPRATFRKRVRYFIRRLHLNAVRVTSGGIVASRARETLYYHPGPCEEWFATVPFYPPATGPGISIDYDRLAFHGSGGETYTPTDLERDRAKQAFVEYGRKHDS